MKQSPEKQRREFERHLLQLGFELVDPEEVKRRLRGRGHDVEAFFAYVKHLEDMGGCVLFSEPLRSGSVICYHHLRVDDDNEARVFLVFGKPKPEVKTDAK